MSNLVRNWFGSTFEELHPLIQKIHTEGGELSGTITLSYGSGILGLAGKRIGRRLGLPAAPGEAGLKVSIQHDNNFLAWKREFAGTNRKMLSRFSPIGCYPEGCWRESTGNIDIDLGVDIRGGGWYWIQRDIRILGVPVPSFMMPTSSAYKTIVDGKYEFGVNFYYPKLGTLLDYRGLLSAHT